MAVRVGARGGNKVTKPRLSGPRPPAPVAVDLHPSPYPVRVRCRLCHTPEMSISNSKTVSRRIAAEMIGIAPATLKKWAIEERGPAVHAKLGDSKQARTLYSLAEIQKWQRDPAAYERRHQGQRHDRRHNAGK